MTNEKKWALHIAAPPGDGVAVAGRTAVVTYGGEPVRGVCGVTLDASVFGVVKMTVQVLASEVDVQGLVSDNVEVHRIDTECNDAGDSEER